ncbi:MAG: CRISPR-associated helicase Cas3' [Thiotrichaceae bacterium]|nr:CRISPR-associated helicase Cas3' [Thiotrichaceae bacterium]
MPTIHAHIKEINGQFESHELADHLQATADLAAQFAKEMQSEEWARLAGLWHDLGKYQPAFQDYIKKSSGYDPKLPTIKAKVDHSSVGAVYAQQQLKQQLGVIFAFLITGHHGGLRNKEDATACLGNEKKGLEKQQLLQNTLAQSPPDSVLKSIALPLESLKGRDPVLWIRLLFSCLVDADFLDTEAFMQPDKTKQRGNYRDLKTLLSLFENHMQALESGAKTSELNTLREQIRHDCIAQATQPQGIFSLTVPTGGGKTLSSLAFALHHALAHGKKRIIYVIPYTSIIEQTAQIFRKIFGEDLIEHHSNLDSDKETYRSRLACENWDAPIIVTTSVQFFESLFAAKTSRTRKLHNILNSVVILDEAQLLPADFLKPILKSIQELANNYRVSFLLMTATQPALNARNDFGQRFEGLKNVKELMADPEKLAQDLQRVQIELPQDFEKTNSWEEIAAQLQAHEQVLCIVNTRQHCRDLHALLPQDTVHLSALMCGEHRSRVIAEIKDKLDAGAPIRVISTQLVEAGVDIDFPVVYRALAGLDSIAQAAGRCNREGGLNHLGKVVVFVPPSQPPAGILRQGKEVTCKLFKTLTTSNNPLSPENFTRYFEELYWHRGDLLDKKAILKSSSDMQFKKVGEEFRFIEQPYKPVIVRYADNKNLLESVIAGKADYKVLRKLQRFVVNVPESIVTKLHNQKMLVLTKDEIYVQAQNDLYDANLGFMGEKATGFETDTLIP